MRFCARRQLFAPRRSTIASQGGSRGAYRRTAPPAPAVVCPADRVHRQFSADCPNQLWVADFTYVPTWVGFVYTAFVIDAFAKPIVGWRTARSMTTELVLDAFEQALHARGDCDGLIHHSDRACSMCRSAIPSA